jgi:hypothetical protein
VSDRDASGGVASHVDLGAALQAATRLREALAAEVEGARGERRMLRSLDAPALFERAATRAAFLSEAARLERAVRSALGLATLAPAPLPLDALRGRGPAGDALADVLSQVRALAGALQEIDRLNLELARRALAVVNGYVQALRPAPRAYDRHGGRASAPALALVSSKG